MSEADFIGDYQLFAANWRTLSEDDRAALDAEAQPLFETFTQALVDYRQDRAISNGGVLYAAYVFLHGLERRRHAEMDAVIQGALGGWDTCG